jgi:glutamyl-tRNA(Gln) amidotransferase subunit D
MKTKTFTPGDKIEIKTKSGNWRGYALESHDTEIILIKLESGYNIGIRENEILNAKIIEKAKEQNRKEIKLQSNKSLPNIVMIITGGTISSRLDPKSGGVIPTDEGEILNIAPKINEICNITIDSPFMKFSEDMDPKDWTKIAKVCEKHLNDKSVDGIIITHGTDTLHYTAAALSFFIEKPNKPIAITYSQRSIDRASTDAALNLICAAKYATSDIAEVALIGHENTNDETCLAISGGKTRKMHSSKRDTFKPINSEPLAKITPEKIDILKTFNARDNSRKIKIDTKFENKVTIIKVHPGQDPSILEYYKQQGYKGIIIEATGLGQVPGKKSEFNWLPKIKNSIDSGMIICATPQTIYGTLNPNVYSAGRDLQKTGIIFLGGMLSETALVKLGWVLGHKSWNPKEKMLEK